MTDGGELLLRPVVNFIDLRLAKLLLSHPFLIGESREFLLKRLEELVFHQGRNVLIGIPDFYGKVKFLNNGLLPERKFKTIYDAAEWIEKSWPDFDLEATPQVTYRPKRE